MKHSAVALVFFNGKIVGLDCAKGRGLILPGGKFDPEQDRTLHDTAKRELFEETGLFATTAVHIYSGFSCPVEMGFFTSCFVCTVNNIFDMKETVEGIPRLVGWTELCNSGGFPAYYNILFDVYNESQND